MWPADGTYDFALKPADKNFPTILDSGNIWSLNTQNGEMNTLVLVGRDDQFDLYVNGRYLKQFRDSTYTDGGVSILLHNDTGKTACSFYDVWLWALE